MNSEVNKTEGLSRIVPCFFCHNYMHYVNEHYFQDEATTYFW